MTSAESLTQKWLRHNVQPYGQRDRVYADVDAALGRFSTLRPKSDVYTYDDGRTQLLLCVHGLLPILFRGASYNIPIAVWLTREYPKEPPITYVVPTNDMLVKAGKYIDVSGRCDIEYLQNWARKSEGCSISALLEAMQVHFSQEPPVYAKPPGNASRLASPRPTAVNDSRGKPPPPLPPNPPSNTRSFQVGSGLPSRPEIPPRPITTYPVPETHPAQTFAPPPSLKSLQGNSGTHGSRSEPPLPPRPPLDAFPPEYRTSYAAPPIPPSDAIPGPSVIHAPSLAPYSSHQSPPLTKLNSATLVPSSSSPPIPPRPLQLSSAVPAPVSTHYHQQQLPPGHPIPQPPRANVINLLDEDTPDTQIPNASAARALAPPPPRPPNPELLQLHDGVHHKLTSELSSLTQALGLDAERLRAHQTDLLAGEPAMRDEMARLEAVRDVCRSVAGRLKAAVQQAEINIAELRRQGDPEVDELICSITIVHNQLISLVAEDNAIEDTIYHLHRALNSGRIDLDRFLRSTRLLAEEQFMKRALIEKIQQGMPMGMSLGSDWS
ncbi:putative UEV-domain-containing protein [Lyophyllum shimeji]|uniref:UEV-domain-containing protein n=1 Tax=Lyophyllum shimeji TaxID=47721 RepID=A0A9P3UI60_LYOSH|nr:putative UEV-domain-containing protein [Lyophyllum shimeji]